MSGNPLDSLKAWIRRRLNSLNTINGTRLYNGLIKARILEPESPRLATYALLCSNSSIRLAARRPHLE